MLSADKDLLLAKLNQDLLGLHLLELNTVLNRFQNAIGASSLLGGFAFAGIVELQLIDGENQTQLLAESVFYLSASLTLALAIALREHRLSHVEAQLDAAVSSLDEALALWD